MSYDTSNFQPTPTDTTPGALGGSYVIGSAAIDTSSPTFASTTTPVALSSRLSGLTAPYPTNYWWTNLFMGDNSVVPLPYMVGPTTQGLGIANPAKTVTQTGIIASYNANISLLASEALNARTITAYDDLTVTLNWPTAGTGYLRTTLAQGMGYVTMVYNALTPIISHTGSALLTVNGVAPGSPVTASKFKLVLNDGRTWIIYASSAITLSTDTNTNMVATAPFTGTLQAALMTASGDEAILDAHSGSYPTAGTVTPTVNANIASIVFNWTVTGTNTLLMHALPHHMDVLQTPVTTTVSYNTLKGATTGIIGNSWTLREVLPTFELSSPRTIASSRLSAIQSALTADVAATYGSGVGDPYFGTKYLARWARLAEIADEIGDTASAATARSKYKADVVAWLDGTNADALKYETRYGGIISTTGASNSGADFGNGIYNDHHFHYGYLVYAAAILAKTDSAFLTSYKTKINEIVRDYANPSRSDTFSVKFRHKDWYSGHSWAQGLDNTGDPKNQESTSESINGYYALVLWGLVSNQNYLAAMGQVLLATEIHSARRYWHIKSADTIYPAPLNANKVIGILWGSKVDYATFFGANTEYIHGIHMLPITPITELYLESDWVTEEYPFIQANALNRTYPVGTSVVNPGSGYTGGPSFVDGGGATYYVLNGLTTTGGTGTGLQINANAHADGTIYAAYIVNGHAGTGYTDADVVTLVGGGGSGATISLQIKVQDTWRSILVADHAVLDPAAAWTEANTLTAYDDGLSKTNLLHWIATRPVVTPPVTPPSGGVAHQHIVTTDAVGGDLSGTFASPTVAKINGVAVTGIPSTGQVPTATSATSASWQAIPTSAVTSVAGRTGIITLAESDITNLTTDLAAKATDAAVVHTTGPETINGGKIFNNGIVVNANDSYFGTGYNGTGGVLHVGNLGTNDAYLEAQSSAADASLFLRTKGAGVINAVADLVMGGHRVRSVLDPIAAQDAATKNYVDTHSRPVFNVMAQGAIADCKVVLDGSITTGTAILTSGTANFTSGDIGKKVTVWRAGLTHSGALGGPLNATISSCTNSTTVVLSANASSTVSSAKTVYGTSLKSAAQAASTAACNAGGGDVYVPAGAYYQEDWVNVPKNNVTVRGDSEGRTIIYSGYKAQSNFSQASLYNFSDLSSTTTPTNGRVEDITFDLNSNSGGAVTIEGSGPTSSVGRHWYFKNVEILNKGPDNTGAVGAITLRSAYGSSAGMLADVTFDNVEIHDGVSTTSVDPCGFSICILATNLPKLRLLNCYFHDVFSNTFHYINSKAGRIPRDWVFDNCDFYNTVGTYANNYFGSSIGDIVDSTASGGDAIKLVNCHFESLPGAWPLGPNNVPYQYYNILFYHSDGFITTGCTFKNGNIVLAPGLSNNGTPSDPTGPESRGWSFNNNIVMNYRRFSDPDGHTVGKYNDNIFFNIDNGSVLGGYGLHSTSVYDGNSFINCVRNPQTASSYGEYAIFQIEDGGNVVQNNFVYNDIPLANPSSALTVAINATAGNLNGAYTYKVTFVTPTGNETAASTASSSVSPVNQQVNLTSIPLGPTGTFSRSIYRTPAGGGAGTQKFVAIIRDNTTTTYTDNIADANLGVAVAPTTNGTTNGLRYIFDELSAGGNKQDPNDYKNNTVHGAGPSVMTFHLDSGFAHTIIGNTGIKESTIQNSLTNGVVATNALASSDVVMANFQSNGTPVTNLLAIAHTGTIGNTQAYTRYRTDNGGMIEQNGSYYDVYANYFRLFNATLEAHQGGYASNGTDWALYAPAASAGFPVQATGNVSFVGRYWNGTSSLDQIAQFRHMLIDTGPNSRMGVFFNGAESFSLLSNGRLGIGTTTPAYPLDVNGTARASLMDKGGQVYNVQAFGAKGDGRTVSDAAITAGSSTVTSPTAAFTSADNGKRIMILGAGSTTGSAFGNPYSLYGTFTYVSATSGTISNSASTTVSGAALYIGTDDTAAFNTALTLASIRGGDVWASGGMYTVASTVLLNSNNTLRFANGAFLQGINNNVVLATTASGTAKNVYKNIRLENVKAVSDNNHCLYLSNVSNLSFVNPEFTFIASTFTAESMIMEYCQNIRGEAYVHDNPGDGVQINGCDYVTFDKINVQNSGDDAVDVDGDFLHADTIPSTHVSIGILTVNGVTNGCGLRLETSSNVSIGGGDITNIHGGPGVQINTINTESVMNFDLGILNISNCPLVGIQVQNAAGATLKNVNIGNCNVYLCGQAGGSDIRGGVVLMADGVNLNGITIDACGKTGGDGGGIVFYKSNGHSVSNVKVTNSPGYGINAWNGSGTVVYTGITISNPTMSGNATNFSSDVLSQSGITLAYFGSQKQVLQGLQLTAGSPASGKVWTASDALGNGTWQTPVAGGGTGSGTVTSVSSADANATVANPSTTPVLTVVSAPKLLTARTINGVAFDGTANITVADSTKVPTTTTVNGHALSSNITIVESDIPNLVTDLAAKQASLSLTTTGTSGAATLSGATLNIPQYSGGSGSLTTTTKGDLAGYSTASARVPIGTDGQVLVADSTQPLGLGYKFLGQSSVLNYVANPSFETGYTGWSNYGSYTNAPVRDNTTAQYGSYSSKQDNAATNGDGGLISSQFSLAAGTYTFSVYAKLSSTVTNANMILRCSQGVVAQFNQAYPGNANWNRYTATFTLSSSQTNMEILLGMGSYGPSSPGVVNYDAVQIEVGSSATAYFDGSSAVTSMNTYSWVGTAGVSQSRRSTSTALTTTDYLNEGSINQYFTAPRAVAAVNNATITPAEVDANRIYSIGYRGGVRTCTSTTTLGNDMLIRCDATAAAFTLTLPDVGAYSGLMINLKKIDSSGNAITIICTGTQQIENTSTLLLTAQWYSYSLQSDGTQWLIFSAR